MHLFARIPFAAVVRAAALIIAIHLTVGLAAAQQPNVSDEDYMGVVRPSATYQPTIIAVPSFGKDDAAPVEHETMARIIRRDLELTGFFKMPPDQAAVNRLNLFDVKQNAVSFPEWQKMGAKHLLMANISSPSAGTLRAYVLLYDIESRRLIINRNIEGPIADVRGLAHKISDEVVRFTKACDGFAQTKFIYIGEQMPGIKEVWMMDSDGFNQRRITDYNSICTTPEWGANGTEIYYTSYHGNRANIYGHMLRSGQKWTIAAYGGTNHSPAWSPASQRIAMILSKDGGSEIYSTTRDGKDLRRLTQSKPNEASPVWSPDGRRIAFTSDEGGAVNIYVMNADGTGRRKLTSLGRWNDAPSWSPDGQRLAFVSRVEGKFDVFIINADGSKASLRRLTMGQGDNESPSWAPNGRHIAFSSNRTGTWQIYLMLDDGTNQVALTNSGRNTQPSWGPAPNQGATTAGR